MIVKAISKIFFQTTKGVDFTVFNVNKFKERLKLAREEKGLNQAELAKSVGVTKASISYYESPTAKTTALPNAKVLYEITCVLGVSLDYLVGDTDYKTPMQKQYAESVTLDLLTTAQASDLPTCMLALESFAEIIQESTLRGIERTTLPVVLTALAQINKIVTSYASHKQDGYLLNAAIETTTLTTNRVKAISTNAASYLKEFTYEAFTPTKEIQDAVQAMVSTLQTRLLEGGNDNGDD